MKITPVSNAGDIQNTSTPEHVRTAKMVAAFNKAGTTEAPPKHDYPVANASKISPEEISAIRASAPKLEETAQLSDNTAELEASSESTEEAKPKVDPEAERRFQQIARQERALRAKAHQQNLEFKKREADLLAREEALKTSQPNLDEYIPKSRIKQDALQVIEDVGVSWDELTQQVVQRQPTDPRITNHIQRLEARIEQLTKQSEDNVKSQQQRDVEARQAAVKQITLDAKSLVNSDPEFELIKSMNAVKDVVELIEKTYDQDGIVLSVEEAAKEVEDYLMGEAEKITSYEKVKRRLAAAKALELKTEVKTQEAVEQKQATKTLTNATSTTRKLTSKERAVARANGFKGDF